MIKYFFLVVFAIGNSTLDATNVANRNRDSIIKWIEIIYHDTAILIDNEGILYQYSLPDSRLLASSQEPLVESYIKLDSVNSTIIISGLNLINDSFQLRFYNFYTLKLMSYINVKYCISSFELINGGLLVGDIKGNLLQYQNGLLRKFTNLTYPISGIFNSDINKYAIITGNGNFYELEYHMKESLFSIHKTKSTPLLINHIMRYDSFYLVRTPQNYCILNLNYNLLATVPEHIGIPIVYKDSLFVYSNEYKYVCAINQGTNFQSDYRKLVRPSDLVPIENNTTFSIGNNNLILLTKQVSKYIITDTVSTEINCFEPANGNLFVTKKDSIYKTNGNELKFVTSALEKGIITRFAVNKSGNKFVYYDEFTRNLGTIMLIGKKSIELTTETYNEKPIQLLFINDLNKYAIVWLNNIQIIKFPEYRRNEVYVNSNIPDISLIFPGFKIDFSFVYQDYIYVYQIDSTLSVYSLITDQLILKKKLNDRLLNIMNINNSIILNYKDSIVQMSNRFREPIISSSYSIFGQSGMKSTIGVVLNTIDSVKIVNYKVSTNKGFQKTGNFQGPKSFNPLRVISFKYRGEELLYAMSRQNSLKSFSVKSYPFSSYVLVNNILYYSNNKCLICKKVFMD